MTNDNKNRKPGIVPSIIVAVTIIMAGLKLAGVIEMSWLAVFAPFLIWLAIVIVTLGALSIAKHSIMKKWSPRQKLAYSIHKDVLHGSEAEAFEIAQKMHS